ncbi:translocase of chloroplast 120, chloroplastic-like [Cynara cardunculus var. scolymus]|uniref:translocase of chloroplast 120, chloroplastic-like n=1 Tax=Cynara cardunculus var. scolymus TaxID=59895 RepID=UPI000D629155|nr:translocase of chloroplast 120, chloroplastic-like [Cynara cardunculus var. scolymus]
MENGVSKVEQLKSKVEQFDVDVLGDGVKGVGTDDVFEEASGFVDSVSATVEVEEVLVGSEDESGENGGDLGVSLELDGSVNAGQVEKFDDACGTPEIQMVNEKVHVDPFEELITKKVIDEESTSGNITRDQPIMIDDGKLVNCGRQDGKVLNLAEVIEERNALDSTASIQPSGLEANEAVNGGNSEAKVLNLVQVVEGESTTDDATRAQASELETGVSVVGRKDESEVVGVTDEHNTCIDVSIDEPNVLETNGVIDIGVNEVIQVSDADNNEGQPTMLEDLLEVTKKPVAVILGNSENGVSDIVDLDENVIHEDRINGDSMSHRTQPDGDIGDEANGDVIDQPQEDVNEKDMLVTEGKDDDSMTQKEKIEISRNNLLDMQNELKVEETEEGEQETIDLSSGHQNDRNLEQGSTSAIDKHDNRVESLNSEDSMHVSVEERTVTPEVERRPLDVVEDEQNEVILMRAGNVGVKLSEPVAGPSEKNEPKDCEVKQDKPVSKEPGLRPVIGVSLSTEKAATLTATPTPVPKPKHDPPNQSPIPNSKLTTVPTPAPSQPPTRPAGLGSGAPLLEPAHRVVQSQVNGNVSPLQNQVIDEPTNGEAEENDDTREKLQMIRVKFLRLARRLGQTPHNVVVAQVLYRLGLAEQLRGRNGGRVAAFSFERASAMAEQLEAAGQEPLEFSCTIMVLGKTGVGKSATINSIFDEVKFGTDAFQLGTKKVQDVVGTVQGIKVRVIDTPGLLPSWADQRKNEKILHSVKRFIQKSPPDIVLYLDRLDMQSRDFGDMPLLRTITDIFGQSIWFNAIVVLTHAASAPPEGPNGTATSYDMFVTQRSHVVQQAIRQAAGDMRLMNPVSLVENHSACRTNRAGQRVLPNGQVWKPHLLLLSFASKILVEANMLLKLQDSPPGKPFAARTRAPPLPFILSNLLQSRPQLKLPQEQFGDDDDDTLDDDLDESSDEESSEYDELPPFKRLTSSQLTKLSRAQKKSYYDELEYREKLFMKTQLKEEKKRRKMMRKMAEAAKNFPSDLNDNNVEEDSNGAATVPVAVQDMNLPVSFDADNPAHRYRALDSANQWLIRPVLDPHGWDHDVGYEGINVEHLLALKEKIPVSFSGQITKDKKDANLQMEVSSAMKHGKAKSTTAAFDMQTIGKEISYTLRSETRFINYRKNKASAGLSATYIGDALTGGVKFEDKLVINKRGQLVVAGGAVIGRGDVAYGGSLEATLRDKDYPLGRFLSTISLSVMDWHGDLALGWNAQSQIPIGRFTNLIGRVNLNNKGSGQVSVRLNSSEQLQIALVALVPLFSKLLGYYQPRDSAY